MLFGNPQKAAARLSHDGKQLAFLAPVNDVLNVWVGPADNPSAAKPVTKDTLRGIRTYFWAYTNDHILYLQDTGGDENWHIYRVDLATNETKDLTPIEKVNAQIEEVSHKFPHEIMVGLNNRDPEVHDVFRVNIETAERKLVQENKEGFSGSGDGRGLQRPLRFAVIRPTAAASCSSQTARAVGRTSCASRWKTT